MSRARYSALAVALALVAQVEAAPARNFLWKATSKSGGALYLVGSVHLLSEDSYPLSPALETAFKEKSAADARCQELSAKMESAIAREVQSQTTALARKWLEAPLQVQRAAEAPAPKDLLDRAEAALARQAAQDPHTGNRLALERRC